jgi:predicted Zn-dependent protease
MRSSVAVLIAACLLACTSLPPDEGEQGFDASDRELEVEIAAQGMESIRRDLPVLANPAVRSYVRRVGERIVAASDRPDITWTFEVIDDDQMNAFTIGDGKVFVYKGLLTRLENEAQLAGVMAHEIAHVTRFHTVITARKSTETELGAEILSGLAGAVLGVPTLTGLAADVSTSIITSGFSREQEDQADRVGMKYAFLSGYDVNEFPRIFEIFLEQGGDAPEFYNDLFGSHSTNRERIDTTRALAQTKYGPLMKNPVRGESEYKGMLGQLR